MSETRQDAEVNLFSAPAEALGRRDFLKWLGPGLYVFFSTEEGLLLGQEARGGGRGYPEDFNAYLRIAEDGQVTCYTGKVELGQGIIASLAQMLAEELPVPFEAIRMVFGDTRLCPWDGGTNGSRSIKYFGPALRAAGAEAREVLRQLAAETLKAAPEKVQLEKGTASVSGDPQKKIGFGLLTRGKTIERHLPKKPPLKPAGAFQVCGRSLPRRDLEEKATGAARFAGDVRLPGMLYGRVLRPPAHGARLKNLDTSRVSEVPGALLVREGDFVGVVHPKPDLADKAMERIRAEFDLPELRWDAQSIHEHLLAAGPRENVLESRGDLARGQALAVEHFDEIYRTPYVAHAPMETHTALAQVGPEEATLWIGTQRPFGAQEEIARLLNLPADKVHVITPYVGGGFGGKSSIGQAIQAARLSRAVGKPVQVAWTREEEFYYDTFMPAAVVRIRSGLDRDRRIVYWNYEVFYAGDRSSQNFYNVPHLRTAARGGWSGGGSGPHPFGTGAWRGPGSNTNIFARESHIDTMAARAGMDPLEVRLRNLTDPRMIRVLRAAADRFGWKPARTPSRRGHGVVCLDYLGTYVAAMAEIEMPSGGGPIRVRRVVHAQDMGPVINPEGARMQIEGGIIMGLGYCLTEEIRFQGGRIDDLSFSRYEIPRFSWTPKIETVLVDNPEIPPSGGGEPPNVGMGGLIGNALFDAAGVRLTRFPFTAARIREKLA